MLTTTDPFVLSYIECVEPNILLSFPRPQLDLHGTLMRVWGAVYPLVCGGGIFVVDIYKSHKVLWENGMCIRSPQYILFY